MRAAWETLEIIFRTKFKMAKIKNYAKRDCDAAIITKEELISRRLPIGGFRPLLEKSD